jgi:exopolyphosphatase/guanosine-5'-triphosphate,3'-diphosphate pyrophosphatase
MNVAAIDLGSNSFGLLVGRVFRDGRIDKVLARKEALRLGEVVAEHGAIPESLFERALGVVRDMVDVARAFDAEAIAAAGTSALRDARNGADFVRAARERTGVRAELLSGDDEAKLVYQGARSALENPPERTLVIDLGGGSVELAMGDGNDCLGLESLPLGFLRVTRDLPLGAVSRGADIARLAAHVRALGEGPLRRLVAFNPRAIILSGGTARALGRVAAALGVRELSAVGLRRLAAHLAGRDFARQSV